MSNKKQERAQVKRESIKRPSWLERRKAEEAAKMQQTIDRAGLRPAFDSELAKAKVEGE
jgi:hypothetical protein